MYGLRLLFLTGAMTGLIWVAADQRVTRSAEIDNVPFELKAATSGVMALTVLDQAVDRMTISFRGPSRAINQLRNVQDTLSITVEISERDPGLYKLFILEELRKQKDQFPKGLAIVSTDPESISIDVDRYVDQTVRLSVGAGDYEFDGSPQLTPTEVVVRVPERKFDSLSTEQRLITIPLDRLLSGQAQATHVQKAVAVPLMLDGGLSVMSVEPQQVTFSATLLEHVKTDRIRTIPIRVILASLDVWQQYELRFTEEPDESVVTRPILIRGRSDLVDAIVESVSRYNIFGVINIARDDLPEGQLSIRLAKSVSILNLPKGVELAEEPEEVEIELLPRP